MIVRPYAADRDFPAILALLQSEGDEWSCYHDKRHRNAYKQSLEKSITFVAEDARAIVGFSRSIEDFGFYIYVCDLLVRRDYRGQNLGRRLMAPLIAKFSGYDVFVMSDVDPYYVKLGYQREGSIFKLPH